MSMKAWQKIDLFLPVFIIVMVLLSAMTIYTFRAIFSTFIDVYDVELNQVDVKLRVDNNLLDQAIKAYYEKDQTPLTIR